MDLADHDGDVRVLDVLLEFGCDLICQLQRCQARSLNVAEERQRDHAVRPYKDFAREGWLLPDSDSKHVGWADDIAAGSCSRTGVRRSRNWRGHLGRPGSGFRVLGITDKTWQKECQNQKPFWFHSATPILLAAGKYPVLDCLSL